MIFFTELFNIEGKRVVFTRPLPDYRGEPARIADWHPILATPFLLPRQVPKTVPSPGTVQGESLHHDKVAPRTGDY